MSLRPVVVAAEVIRYQVDRLGYTFCGEHADESRGGTVRNVQAQRALRSAETDLPALWTCDRCGRHITDWPRETVTMQAMVEHTTCRIF